VADRSAAHATPLDERGEHPELTGAKRRLLSRLKRTDSATAPELAAEFGLTDTAIRQHLEAMETGGLVERAPSSPNGRGRPPVAWRLTELAESVFPDRHSDLTVDLLDAVRRSLGPDALDAVLGARADAQLTDYRASLARGRTDLLGRVRALASRRTAEGYLAEAEPDADGAVVLVEHHCPIAEAARSCEGLCRTELDLFRRLLGEDVTVERTSHLLAGDQRCAYRITLA
jgi:predicted ArsR family transcriptional regulator